MKTNKLQDIKRSELLDKLEQEWLVRRKAWADENHYASINNYPLTGNIYITDLLKDDWEGYPPVPKLRMHQKGLNFENALWLVNRQETVFLRHSKWGGATQYIGWKDNKIALFDESLNVIRTNVNILQSWFDGPVWEVWVDSSKKL